jgi:hypothetical protein
MAHEIGSQGGQPIVLTFRPTERRHDVISNPAVRSGLLSSGSHDREAEAVRSKVPTHKFHLGQPVEFNPPRGIYALAESTW